MLLQIIVNNFNNVLVLNLFFPVEVVEAVELGIDVFDTVYPFRIYLVPPELLFLDICWVEWSNFK